MPHYKLFPGSNQLQRNQFPKTFLNIANQILMYFVSKNACCFFRTWPSTNSIRSCCCSSCSRFLFVFNEPNFWVKACKISWPEIWRALTFKMTWRLVTFCDKAFCRMTFCVKMTFWDKKHCQTAFNDKICCQMAFCVKIYSVEWHFV